ncbi:MAG: thermonuclease family protein [Actinobacteria bacterium]|nr:thermonuclease family protein [Actinomycetota bacterium]
MREILPFFIILVVIIVLIFIFSSYLDLPEKIIGKLDQKFTAADYFEEGLSKKNAQPTGPSEYSLKAKVVDIIGGDTLKLDNEEIVKLIGVVAPLPDESFYEDALNKCAELTLNKEIFIETDKLERDEEGRLLGYIWVENLMINAELIKTGFVRFELGPPNIKYMAFLSQAQEEARTAKVGIWSIEVAEETTQTTQETQTTETIGETAASTETQVTESTIAEEFRIKKIIFASDMDGDSDIYSMNLDGSELVNLTNNTVEDLYPAASPDGSKIAYTSAESGNWDIWIMNSDGSQKDRLTSHGQNDAYPTWSYDMQYLFFESDRDGDWEIYRIRTDGSEEKRITYNPKINDWHPSAHPSEQMVVYESGANDTYKMDFDGNNITKISLEKGWKRVPDISPDGGLIVFVSYIGGHGDNNRAISIMNFDGSGTRLLYDREGYKDAHPAFSPDEKLIVFESGKSDSDDIILMNADGSNLVKLTDTPNFKDWDADFLYQR